MEKYYVETIFSVNGKNMVHKYGCTNMPEPLHREYLGMFASCHGAVLEAKRRYSGAVACVLCSYACTVSTYAVHQ